MNKEKLIAVFSLLCSLTIITGCAAYKLNMDKEHVYIHANNHWHDSQVEGINVSVHQGDTNAMPDLTLSVGSYEHSVNSNLVTLVDKSMAGLAQDLTSATALVNALEGGGVSTASSNLLNSLLANAQALLTNGKTNETAVALANLNAAIAALQGKTATTAATGATCCVTNADGSVTCSSGACSESAK